MDVIIEYFNSYGSDLFKTFIVLLVGSLLIGIVSRFIFGRQSSLGIAVSSSFGIIFIYVVTVLLSSAGVQFKEYIVPLPFASIQEGVMNLHAFTGNYQVVCAELLSMVILAFLVNLSDRWLPDGTGVISWVLYRALTVACGYMLHLIVVHLFNNYLPDAIVNYAPVVMLVLLLILLLTGISKFIIGTILSTTVNPFIGAMYTFFFANAIGKMVTRAIFTTGILSGLIYLLNHIGVTVIVISTAALSAFLPFLLVLIVLWYITFKIC